ncbi:MAG: serine hydrolase [Chitinophagaceae bacterium]|nr:serine hydrolase [Chitinophagaceae bacterium]
MKKVLLLIITIIIFLIQPFKPAKAQTFNPLLASMLQDSLTFYVNAISNIKGMSAAVYLPGQGIWQGTAGVSYAGQPITSNMGFCIASNTKLFFAAAILKLVDNNILSLDDSLSDWLPTYPNINPNITIRQILNHTSGVDDPFFVSPWIDTIAANPTRVFTPTEVLGWAGPPDFPPGTSWGYSNMNYVLAEMVVQSATGIHISQIIRDSILTPLNLDSTFYDVKEPRVGLISHRWYNGIDYNDTSMVGLNTVVGAMFSKSDDMVKWYHALMSGQIISPASFAELTNFTNTYGPPYTYGLGLERQVWFGHTTYGHGGSTWGYKSKMFHDTCMGSVVCGLANSFPAGMDGITLILHRVLVNHVPGCPGIINGLSTVVQGQNNVTYTTTPIANATSYVWTLPNGATGISNTNSITVNYGSNAVSGQVTVRGNNQYGVGNVSSLFVTVQFPLPVTLNHFSIEHLHQQVVLHWETASETDCDYFSIERSDDGVNFQSIGQVKGYATSHIPHRYQFTDPQPYCATSYYRLQQVDFNKVAQYSSTLTSSITCEGITISPNPFSDQCILRFHTLQHNLQLNIADLQGKVLRSMTCSGTQYTLTKGDLKPGTYFLQGKTEGRTRFYHKIIVQ